VAQLLHDDTFGRLCRGRDLLAAEYQSHVLLEQAARVACLSEFHFHRLFRATLGETPKDQFYAVEAVFKDPFGNWFRVTPAEELLAAFSATRYPH
jgi:AraC-like DNA-binding protein